MTKCQPDKHGIINVAAGGRLSARGTLTTDVTIPGGGTLSSGASPGQIFVTGNLTIDPGATFKLNLDGRHKDCSQSRTTMSHGS
jgi:hypothetical protein